MREREGGRVVGEGVREEKKKKRRFISFRRSSEKIRLEFASSDYTAWLKKRK